MRWHTFIQKIRKTWTFLLPGSKIWIRKFEIRDHIIPICPQKKLHHINGVILKFFFIIFGTILCNLGAILDMVPWASKIAYILFLKPQGPCLFSE